MGYIWAWKIVLGLGLKGLSSFTITGTYARDVFAF